MFASRLKNSSHSIGFVTGTFDLAHAGHLLMLEEARTLCDYLIVGVCIDPSCTQKEKNRPIESIFERLVRLSSVKYVDEVIVYETESEKKTIIETLYAIHGQNFVRIMGEEYRDRCAEIDKPIRILYNSRAHSYSSSSLRKRVYEAERNK